MSIHRILVGLCLFVCAIAAQAQVAPSQLVPMAPCRFFDSRVDPGVELEAQSTTYLLVRGACNVPVEANAILVTAAATGANGNGFATIWESSLPRPSASTFNFRGLAGADSSLAFVRLCYPANECSTEDIAVYVSADTHVILDVVGFTVPAE